MFFSKAELSGIDFLVKITNPLLRFHVIMATWINTGDNQTFQYRPLNIVVHVIT